MSDQRPVGQRSTAWHRAKAEATRSALLEGAARVFDRVGYRNAVISAISKESNTTGGAMYHYFPSKEAIALAVIAESRNHLLSLFQSAQADSPVEKLIDTTAAQRRLLSEDPLTRASLRMVLEPGTFTEHPSDYLDVWNSAVTDLVTEAVAKGELSDRVRPEQVARRLIADFVGASVLAGVEEGTANLQSDLEAGLKLILTDVATPQHAERIEQRIRESFSSTGANE